MAPALLILWLVVAADERPGPAAKVWTAFLLGAASISLLGAVRAPFASILAAPEGLFVAQVLHSVFGVAIPEETVKILAIVIVSPKRRHFADPMDSVVYGAAVGLGFAAYENLAYLVQHAEMWQSLAALRSVLTVPFHAALGIIAGAYLAIARSGTALGAHRHHRDWARISSRILIPFAPMALHAGFDFPLLTLQQNPDIGGSTRLILGSASLLIGFSSIAFAVRLVRKVGRHHAPRTEIARERLSQLRRMWALLVVGGGAGFAGLAFGRSGAAGGHDRNLYPRSQPDAHDLAGVLVRARPRLDQWLGRFAYTRQRTKSLPPRWRRLYCGVTFGRHPA